MSLTFFIRFIYALAITDSQRQLLTSCTLYGKKVNTVKVLSELCACRLTHKIKAKKLEALCKK